MLVTTVSRRITVLNKAATRWQRKRFGRLAGLCALRPRCQLRVISERHSASMSALGRKAEDHSGGPLRVFVQHMRSRPTVQITAASECQY